jgi:hypothetical protein
MRNTIPRNKQKLLTQILLASEGAATEGDAIGIKHHTAAKMSALHAATMVAVGNYEAAKTAVRERRAAFRSSLKVGRAFATLARELLKVKFGVRYSQAWHVAGFKGALAIPRTVENVLPLIDQLAAYFTAHPGEEVAVRGITAAAARDLSASIGGAATTLIRQSAEANSALKEQSKQFAAITNCLRGLIKELDTLIGPADSRWKTFGLNKPGARRYPTPPPEITVKAINETTKLVQWEPVPHADHYRVWKKIEGVDADFVPVGSPTDPQCLLPDLPPGARVEVAVSTVNNRGESRRGASGSDFSP